MIDGHAGGVSTRFSADGLAGVIDDVMHLSAADLIVGTFSSQISRVGWEIAQINNTYGSDAALNYHSVDSVRACVPALHGLARVGGVGSMWSLFVPSA